MTDFRTRQAPSPTGYLHFGSARQMLFTKLFAKAYEGSWYLRVEDTDRKRLKPDAVKRMLNSLKKLNLLADEGVVLDGKGQVDDFYGVYQQGSYGPYIQSERLRLYHKHAQNLIDRKLAYWSYLSEEDVSELMEIKKIRKKSINYYKANLERFSEESLYVSVEDGLQHEQNPSLRYHIQRDSDIECFDELLGKTVFDLNLEEDFNILKSDGYPTYHLAHLIDDHLMKTSLVLRAQEWYPSIGKHTVMFKDYWNEIPKYVHVPFILGETGNKKMSKRDGDVDIEDYLRRGFLPEAIINYLAFLGWNPGTEQELFLTQQDFETLDQQARLDKLIDNISKEFSIDKISRSPARFNLEKLTWFNKEYIKMLTLHEFCYLAAKNKLEQKPADNQKLFLGDYVYLADVDEDKVYCKLLKYSTPAVENSLSNPIGAGRANGMEWFESLKREVGDVVGSDVKLEKNKLKSVVSFNMIKGSFDNDGEVFDGKAVNLYYYPTLVSKISNSEDNSEYGWRGLSAVIKSNEYTTYPIWQNFCLKNNIDCFQPDQEVMMQYMASYLDKQRIETLSEAGLDSDSVTKWRKPKDDNITWKKITYKESLQSLQNIYEQVISPMYESSEGRVILGKQQQLYEMAVDPQSSVVKFKELLNEVSDMWQFIIKDWLSADQKDTGSHLWPLRVALSGKKQSPSPFELLTILPKTEVQKRILKVIENNKR